MKKIIFVALVILLMVAIAPTKGNENNTAKRDNPLVGQWVNQKNDILKFSGDKKVFFNGNKIGRYRIEGENDEIIVVDISSGPGDNKIKYYKLEKDNQNRLTLINLNSENKSKEGTFNKIHPRLD